MEGQVLNISPLVVWVVALSQLLSFGLAVYGLFASGSRTNARMIEDHGKRIDVHDRRLASVEQSVGNLPTDKHVTSMALAMTEMRGDIKVMRAEMVGTVAIMGRLEAIVSRHDNHLLRG